MAHLSQDKELIHAFNHGIDVHTATASKIYHVTLEEVTPEMRRRAFKQSDGAGDCDFGNRYKLRARPCGHFQHFALYGAPEAGRDYNTVDMSHQRMFNEYMLPYQAAVEEGVGSVMASFNEVDGVPATGNKWLMTDVLRKQWNFDGFVVTDYTGITVMITFSALCHTLQFILEPIMTGV